MALKGFPNGFANWHESHFEVVQAITIECMKEEPKGLVKERQEAQGHGGLYELAVELTYKFETIHKGREWDGDYIDTIEEFLKKELGLCDF